MVLVVTAVNRTKRQIPTCLLRRFQINQVPSVVVRDIPSVAKRAREVQGDPITVAGFLRIVARAVI